MACAQCEREDKGMQQALVVKNSSKNVFLHDRFLYDESLKRQQRCWERGFAPTMPLARWAAAHVEIAASAKLLTARTCMLLPPPVHTVPRRTQDNVLNQ